MKIFVVNGKEYKPAPFDFNLLCDLEDMGVPADQMQNKPMSMARAYFAICAGEGKKFAGKELEAHLIAGGTMDALMESMGDEMEKSNFFQTLNKGAEAETPESQGAEEPVQ